jgi:hypothetical protein
MRKKGGPVRSNFEEREDLEAPLRIYSHLMKNGLHAGARDELDG